MRALPLCWCPHPCWLPKVRCCGCLEVSKSRQCENRTVNQHATSQNFIVTFLVCQATVASSHAGSLQPPSRFFCSFHFSYFNRTSALASPYKDLRERPCSALLFTHGYQTLRFHDTYSLPSWSPMPSCPSPLALLSFCFLHANLHPYLIDCWTIASPC